MEQVTLLLTDPGSSEAPAKLFAKIAVPAPLGRMFTYGVSGPPPSPGCRVFIELGRRKCLGVVIEVTNEAPAGVDLGKIKPILEVLDQEPTLPQELLQFLIELAKYYLAPIGEVMRLGLPILGKQEAELLSERHGKKLKSTGAKRKWVRLSPNATHSQRLTPKAEALLAFLRERGELSLSELEAAHKGGRAVAKRLAASGLLEIVDDYRENEDRFFEEPVERDQPPPLNADQSRALGALREALAAGRPASFLLDGVTGSGKTEIYLRAAAVALEMGRGVLILVPEIALTPQLVARFRARLGDEIAVVHSELSPKQRRMMWRNIRSGKNRVVVGARSALFSPVQDLGLICVDEEHDPSFKQEEGVRYQARDMALLRARRASAICVLGSATPSLATAALVRSGRLGLLELKRRARETATLPEVRVIDLKRVGPGPSGDPLLSLELHRAIEENLKHSGQTILFLNRRGFSPSVICESCGAVFECPNCSVALTLHRAHQERLLCHYCGFQAPALAPCPSCGEQKFSLEGIGTEQIEVLLQASFPTARVARLDRDVASGTKSASILERMRRREIDILVGTQMVAKGHDLPEVTLVGVLNADAGLSLPDFRAAERTFQLLVQVAGRAGRAERPGKVLIQTRDPSHPAIVAATRHDVRAFLHAELGLREEADYPPFSHLALVRFEGRVETDVASEALRIMELSRGDGGLGVEFLGPTPAPLSRLQNRYRYRFLVRSSERSSLRTTLLRALRARAKPGVNVQVDIDPQSFF